VVISSIIALIYSLCLVGNGTDGRTLAHRTSLCTTSRTNFKKIKSLMSLYGVSGRDQHCQIKSR